MPAEHLHRPKYVFVTGGVLSSVGKGAITASTGKMLQARGFTVTAVKIDPYINYDAGLMNPFMHGEVFVTEDGGEVDLDLGHYERFLDVNLSKLNNITTGQVYLEVISRERRGEYLGSCVQIIPHVTDEIKRRIRLVGETSRADVVLVEVGGTVGDIESLPFLEAIRQMGLEEGEGNTLFIHVALVPILDVTGEFKTKALQHSVQELRRIGIQPDIIVARSPKPIDEEARRKIALYGNVPPNAVFTSYNVDCIYELPLILDQQGFGDYVVKKLRLDSRPPRWDEWRAVVERFKGCEGEVRIAMCGKYTKLVDSYISINEALKHAGAALGVKVRLDFIETEGFEEDPSRVEVLEGYDGIMVLPGFGARGAEGKIMAAGFARERGIPFLGICFGMQLAVVEFARNVAGLKDANSTEIDPKTPHPVIDLLPEQVGVDRLGGTMRLGAQATILEPGTLAYRLYGQPVIFERHRHRYEVNPAYWDLLQRKGMVFSGYSPDKRRIEVIELPDHPFYLGTQFHPEFKSRPGKPSPVYLGFVRACLERRRALGRAT
ncbi:CTP synthetase [Candidatus Geothermarchaeota archaeon ex4572_27]|nr:MAG: CTP synthetase [Candidatus Geothermarchaeota archaeon ex4572_27]